MYTRLNYMGKGELFLGLYGANKQLSVGNCSDVSIGIEEEEITVPSFVQAGGGNENLITRVKKVTFSIKTYQLSPENLAIATTGETSSIVAAAVVDEVHVVNKGALVPLDFVPDPTVAMVVKDDAGATNYVEGTDYIVTGAGPQILAGGAIADGDTVKVSYTKAAANVIEALTKGQQEYAATFVGLNEAESGKAVIGDVWKIKMGRAKSLPLVGDQPAQLELAGEALVDSSIVAAGRSQYYRIRQAA